jgi:hypothetical protein
LVCLELVFGGVAEVVGRVVVWVVGIQGSTVDYLSMLLFDNKLYINN